MKKEFNILGFKKLANILQIITNIFYQLSKVGTVLSILAIPVLLLITHGDLTVGHFTNGSLSFSLNGSNGLQFNLPKIEATTDLTRVIISLIGMVFVYCLSLTVIFRQIRDILKTINHGTPFEEKNAKRLVNVGAVLIGGSILFKTITGLVITSIIDTFGIKNISYVGGIDMYLLLTGLLMLILAGVFRYGSYLQNEYDTTL